ncbi:MAG: glutamate 5-kinase [Candidatus Omnitrophota bacterium]
MKSDINYKRIVIKIGTSILTDKENHLDTGLVNNIAYQVSSLIDAGKEVILVSSGAIASGLDMLGLKRRPTQLKDLSALASLGQIALMDAYQESFKNLRKNCAQVLLTWDDFDNRSRFLNAKKTLVRLLEYKAIPIINENDSVSTEEIKFGDNDKLSALVANLLSADILIILSDVDGLYERKEKRLIYRVEKVDNSVMRLACGSEKFSCVGGMYTKLEAIKIANDAGIPAILANGKEENILVDIVGGREVGTYFCAGLKREHKKIWIASGTKPKGKILVDEGAKVAIISKNTSLLSVGIVEVIGEFKANSVVLISDKSGNNFAKGITKFSSSHINQIRGKKGQPEVVHRNDLVLI